MKCCYNVLNSTQCSSYILLCCICIFELQILKYVFTHSLSNPLTCEQERPLTPTVFLHHMQVEERMGSAVPGLFLLLLFLAPGCWAGDCKGQRQILRGPLGYVTDGPGNYSVNGNCEWLITGECQNKKTELNQLLLCTRGAKKT